MNNKTTDNIPDSILELLPWFTIDKLSIEDKLIFENALLSYPSLQQHLKHEQQLIEKVSMDNSILDKSVIPAIEERLKTVFNMIDHPEILTRTKELSDSSTTTTVLDRVKNIVNSLIPRQDFMQQYSRVAGVACMVLSVAALTTFAKPLFTHTSDFVPASAVTQSAAKQAESTNNTKTVLLVGFNGTSEELSNINALKGKQINIESPPDKDGFFQISFKQTLNADEIKTTIDSLLKNEEMIWFAGEAF